MQALRHRRQCAALQQYPQCLRTVQADRLEQRGAAATGFDLVGALWSVLQQGTQCLHVIALHGGHQSRQRLGIRSWQVVAIGLVGDLAFVAPVTALDAQEIGDQSDRNAGRIQRPVAGVNAVAPATGEYDQAVW
ncbi:hypothetical protein [Stenotrophomonas maltophilia]|uniref:hypothetical protein n=1 Tax=Stenotrophomonas maltophilia TaxID=40324 RepID=UPI002556DFDB|nr:hypothetical protein [Stenotrophomonas maltophilia]